MKFKNIKKDKNSYHKPQKEKKVRPEQNSFKVSFSPKIYRFITESYVSLFDWKRRQFWLYAISTLAFLGFIIVCSHIYDLYQLSKKVQKTRLDYQKRLSQWEDITKEFPGFRDGYLQAAMISYQLGDIVKSKKYTQEAINVDPNFIQSRKMSSILGMTEKEEIQN